MSLYPQLPATAAPPQMGGDAPFLVHATAVEMLPATEGTLPVVVASMPVAMQAEVGQQRWSTGAEAVPDSEALQALSGRGFPRGLAKEVVDSTRAFPIRMWVVDNSGSMQSPDGSRMVALAGGGMRMMQATRWHELCDTIGAIGEMAEATGGRTDLFMLNPPPSGSPQYLSVGGQAAGDASPAAAIPQLGPRVSAAQLRQVLQSVSPSGGTPLTEAVLQIVSLLQPVAAALSARGEQAVVVLATDGLPNDAPSFLHALQTLQTLPVWVVVRLCTNDDNGKRRPAIPV